MTDNNEDFGKAKGDTMSLISDIKFNIALDEAKRDELSPLKTAEKLFQGIDMQEFVKAIKIISAFQKFYGFIPGMDDPTKWLATNGYAAIIQGYVNHPLADEFAAFHERAQTLKDVLMWILEKEGMSLNQYLTYVPRLDKSWFLANIAEQTLLQFIVISGNQNEYDFEMKEARERIEQSHKKVLEQEALHATLMKD